MVKGRPKLTSTNARMKPWRQQVGMEALMARGNSSLHKAGEGPFKITVMFTFAKPKSAPKSRGYPTVKPDIDKLLRAILDACTGVLWRDDAQVVEVVMQKQYSSPERAYITVEEL